MKPSDGLLTSMISAVYALPWAWLVSFALFTAAVTLATGHFPSYGNPDPKSVSDLNLLYMLTVELLLLAVVSPVLVGVHVAWRALERHPVEPQRLIAFGTGVTLSAAVLLGDAFGLGTWLFD